MDIPNLLFANNATSRLYQNTPAGSSTVRVEAGDGAKFPDPIDPEGFTVTLEDRRTGQTEICFCTSRSGDILTVLRGQEGTVAQDFAVGATVSNRLTAGTMEILIGGAGIPEAPSDGKVYGRGDVAWKETLLRTQIEALLNLKAPINNPVLTGDPKAPTPSVGDNDTSIATTEFVTNAVLTLGGDIDVILGGKVDEAPANDLFYARVNEAWGETIGKGTYDGDQANQDYAISQNEGRITAVESVNNSQDTAITNLTSRITNAEAVNTTQDNRLTAVENKNTAQDTAINGKEPAIAAGNPSYFWAGDKTWKPTAPFPEAPLDGQQYARQSAAWAAIVIPPATSIGDTPPTGPAQGQLWWESDTGDMYIWYDDGSGAQWVQTNGPGYPTVAISDTAPPGPTAGMLWWQSSTGRLFTYYTDANSSQWVQISGPQDTQNFMGRPAGEGVDWWGPTAPSGTRFCYGQSLAVASYAALFGIIGYTFGGSGANFLLPDCRGRVTAGKDNMGGTSANRVAGFGIAGANFDGDVLGAAGGAEIVQLSLAQMPSHVHTPTYSGNALYFNAGGGGYRVPFTSDGTSTPLSTTSAGSDQAHGNMQPTIVCNKLICTGGVI